MRNIRLVFLLLIVLVVALPAQAQIRDGRVNYGTSYQGEIVVEDEYAVVAFTGSAGDIVTITVTAPPSVSLDPLFYVFYGDIWLSYNDDAEDASVGSFNSQIKDFVLPHTGTYDIYVGGYGGTGAFTVSVDFVGSIQEIDAFPLNYGDTVTGTLETHNNFYFYQFQADAGDDISVLLLKADPNSALDTIFYIYDSDFFPLAVVDDNANTEDANYDAILDHYILHEAGTYYLLATRFEGIGAFNLTLSSSATPTGTTAIPTSPSTSGSALTYGGSATGYIDSTTTEAHYTFNGTAGDQVTITMIAEQNTDLDSLLKLVAPSGSVVVENDDAIDVSVGRFNSQIVDFELPVSGEYTIIATRFSGSGNFTVSLDSGSAADSASNPPTTGGQSFIIGGRLAYDPPAGWVTSPADGVTLVASSDDVLNRSMGGEPPQLAVGEQVMVVIEMPLGGAGLETVFENVQNMLTDGNTVYGDMVRSGADSRYTWMAIHAENTGVVGLLYGVDTTNTNAVFIQTLYGGSAESAMQIVETFINSIRYE